MEKNTEKSKFNFLSQEEESINTMLFAAWVFLTVGAFIVVVLILKGPVKDWIALAVTAVGVVMRILEKKTQWFKKYAKYAYLTLPIWCTCGLVLDNGGRFAAVTQAWFFLLALSTAYYDVKMVLFCAGVTVFSTVGALILFPEAMLKLDSLWIWFYIFSVYIMAFGFSVFIAKRMRKLLEKTRQMKTYEEELVYLEQLEKKEQKHSEFIHNMNHYFVAIGELARAEHCDQIVNLVEELNGKLSSNERIIYTTHKVLNAILSEKKNKASEQQIEFDIYVEPIIRLENIADGDLVAMLGNLLDNALEAASQCEGENRKISVRVYMEKEGKICVIKVWNYFVSPRVRHKSGFISTKRNRERHGIGMKSIENTAKKYGGYLQCFLEEERFTAILILPVQK